MTGRRWGGKGVEEDRKRRKVREELGDMYVCHRLVLCQKGGGIEVLEHFTKLGTLKNICMARQLSQVLSS